MASLFRLMIAMVLLSSLAYCVSGCAPVNATVNPPYTVCDTPDCGTNAAIIVE